MRCTRSRKRNLFLARVARECNARRAELIAAGIDPAAAAQQASDEIVKPLLAEPKRRTVTRI